MNCLDFNDKKTYMDFVQNLSDKDIILQRKLMSNLLDLIKTKYQTLISDIHQNIIGSCDNILEMHNIDDANSNFKKLLSEVFKTFHISKTMFLDLKNYSNYVCNDSDYSRDDSIQIIDKTYNELISEDENGVYDKCISLLNLIINQSAIFMYRLYNVALLDEKELKPFLSAPKALFGGLNEKGEPDLKYSIQKYIHQIQFDIKYVEGEF